MPAPLPIRFRAVNRQQTIVVMTGLDDDRLAVAAVKAGAQDYLVKGEDGVRVVRRAVRYAIERGRVVQSNFHDYPVLRIDEMPVIEVHLVPSGDAPGGVGEPGVPPIAPAVANALAALTGQRVRQLPIALKEDLNR